MEHSDRDPEALAAELDSRIMAQDRAAGPRESSRIGYWKGTGWLSASPTRTWAAKNRARITAAYEFRRKSDTPCRAGGLMSGAASKAVARWFRRRAEARLRLEG